MHEILYIIIKKTNAMIFKNDMASNSSHSLMITPYR